MTLKYKIGESMGGVVKYEKKSDSPQNWLQNSFLEDCVKIGKEVEVITMDGKRIVGVISAYDNYSFLMETASGKFLVYKHGVIYLKGGR